MPLVSVIMPVYNGESYLKDAINSILNQSFQDLELLIIDDCSSDRSVDIINSYDDPRVKHLGNKENMGQSKSRNLAISKARGRYIALMDADDISLHNRIESQVKYLEKNKDISILGTNIKFIGSREIENKHVYERHEEIACKFLFGSPLVHPSVMIRKSDIDRHNLKYDEQFLYAQDYNLWVSAWEKGLKFSCTNEILLHYRVHDKQVSIKNFSKQSYYANEIRKKIFSKLRLNLTEEEMKLFNLICLNGLTEYSVDDLILFEKILLNIINSNKKVSVLNQDILELICVDYFKSACNKSLRQLNRSGRYFWRSEIKDLYKNNHFVKFKMLLASLVAYKN
ncbi:glycosyltransferase family 2 protein [Neobacillus vireti]|uniref:glycosyltransferase family 2 protein n=1 Tax=Neobacillus vireti TaxID=220686 RepID=UPI002FFED80E